MKSSIVLSSMVLGLSLFLVNPALAEDSPCSGETGAAFGLCNAYCEAMDCEGDPEASENACDRVASKFMRITDRPLTCGVTCPCVDGYAQVTHPIPDSLCNPIEEGIEYAELDMSQAPLPSPAIGVSRDPEEPDQGRCFWITDDLTSNRMTGLSSGQVLACAELMQDPDAAKACIEID